MMSLSMPLNPRRLAFVKKIYHALDIDGSGDLTVHDFGKAFFNNKRNKREKKKRYLGILYLWIFDFIFIATRLDFSNHPDYLSGKKTQGDLIVEYMSPFETHEKD